MTRVDAFVDKHAWQILALVVSGIILGTTAKAQLDGKAEMSDVVAIRRDVQDLKDLVCQLPQYKELRSCHR